MYDVYVFHSHVKRKKKKKKCKSTLKGPLKRNVFLLAMFRQFIIWTRSCQHVFCTKCIPRLRLKAGIRLIWLTVIIQNVTASNTVYSEHRQTAVATNLFVFYLVLFMTLVLDWYSNSSSSFWRLFFYLPVYRFRALAYITSFTFQNKLSFGVAHSSLVHESHSYNPQHSPYFVLNSLLMNVSHYRKLPLHRRYGKSISEMDIRQFGQQDKRNDVHPSFTWADKTHSY